MGKFIDQSDNKSHVGTFESREFFQFLVRHSLDSFVLIGRDGIIVKDSISVSRVLGYTSEQITGKSYIDFITDEDKVEAEQLFISVLEEKGNIGIADVHARHADGSERFISVHAVNCLHDPAINGIIVQLRDITTLKYAEEAVRRREERFRAMAENSPDPIARYDLDFRCVYLNPIAEVIIAGEEGIDYTGKSHAELGISPKYYKPWHTAFKKVVKTGKEISGEHKYSIYGKTHYYQARIVPELDDNGNVKYILSISREITKMKEAQRHLERINHIQKIANLFLTAAHKNESVVAFFEKVNLILQDHFKLKEACLFLVVGKRIKEIYSSTNTSTSLLDKNVRGQINDFITLGKITIQDNREFSEVIRREFGNATGLVVGPISDGGKILGGLLFTLDQNLNKLDRFLLSSIGESIGVALTRVLAQQKISELNQKLEKRVEERTYQLKALNAELESFSYSVAHDLRGPLRSISGFSGLLEKKYGKKLDNEALQYLQFIQTGTVDMANLIDDLLTFSGLGKNQVLYHKVDLQTLVSEIIAEFKIKPEVSRYTFEIGELPEINADRAMIRQVLKNLIDNAIKYSANMSKPHIEVGLTKGAFFVSDNGVGLEMQYSDRIFGVFERLHDKEEFGGTGVGLAIVHRIIIKHGGEVWVESSPGKGAVFYFTIPDNKKYGTTERGGNSDSGGQSG